MRRPPMLKPVITLVSAVSAALDHAAAASQPEVAVGQRLVVPGVVIPAGNGHFDDFFDFPQELALVLRAE